MLMVTTTVGMLDGVHGHTSDPGPAVPLDSVLVVSSAGLEHGLVATTATSDDADRELSLLTAVDELAGGDAFGGDHDLLPLPVLVGVVEDHPGEGSAAAGVVHDVLDE